MKHKGLPTGGDPIDETRYDEQVQRDLAKAYTWPRDTVERQCRRCYKTLEHKVMNTVLTRKNPERPEVQCPSCGHICRTYLTKLEME